MPLLMSGCNKKIEINLNDYRSFEGYSFQHHKFLMRKGEEEADILGGIYSLKGLSPKDYVGHVQYSIIPGYPTKTLYGNQNIDEPIITLNPHRIQLTFDDNTLILDDTVTIEQLVAVRRKDGTQTSSYPDVYADRRINMTFLFDIPSGLTWNCDMLIEAKNIKMLWYDNKTKEQYICDVTDILKQHPMIEDIYSLGV